MELKESWEKCMKMWRSFDFDEDFDIHEAKRKYCAENNIVIEWSCWFCDYIRVNEGIPAPYFEDEKHKEVYPNEDNIYRCPKCPGSQVDPEFNCEGDLSKGEYSWIEDPEGFLKRLEELYEIFLKGEK